MLQARLLAGLCALGIAVTTAGEPPRLVALGTGRQAFAVAGDDLDGNFLVAGRSAFGSPFGRGWNVDQTINVDEVLLSPVVGGDGAAALSISRGSRFVAGYTSSTGALPFEATVWRAGQWQTPLAAGALPGDATSQALDVSDAGVAVGVSGGQHPFYWSVAEGSTGLPFAPGALQVGPEPIGRAEWISADSRWAAGAIAESAGNFRAVVWRGFEAQARWLQDPFRLDSLAVGGSNNGRNYAGDLLDGTDFVAAVWLDGKLTILEDENGMPMSGRATAVLDDGTAFGAGRLAGATRAFVWNPAWGATARSFASYFLDSGGTAVPVPLDGISDAVAFDEDYLLAIAAADGDFFGRVPAVAGTAWEVGELVWSGSERLTWDAQGSSASYDIGTGSLDSLRLGAGSLAGGTCLATALRDPWFDDLDREALLPGEGLWFLVRSRRNGAAGRWDGDYSEVTRVGVPECPATP